MKGAERLGTATAEPRPTPGRGNDEQAIHGAGALIRRLLDGGVLRHPSATIVVWP